MAQLKLNCGHHSYHLWGAMCLMPTFKTLEPTVTKASSGFTGFMNLFLRSKILTFTALTVPYLMLWEVLMEDHP